MENIVDCLEQWARTHPNKILFNFLDGRGNSREQYTFQQFYERVVDLSHQLTVHSELQHGDRVLLVYPPGLEMIVGFFACVELGAIPVPVSAPMTTASKAAIRRIEHVARDCGASIALTTANYLRSISGSPSSVACDARVSRLLPSMRWSATDNMAGHAERIERQKANPILFLQYTSGSTGDPKGVIVTHRNVVHNAHASFQHCPVGVSWLPQYHDMGLIGHYLFMVVLGGTNHGFSPFDFLRRPALWLQTISKMRATITGAPNFAYDYCLRQDKVPDSALRGVDLSSMKMMLNAAEPIQPQTYERFFERFAKYGLPRESFEAGYGLAENTLGVARRGRHVLTVQKKRLQRRQLSIHKTMTRNNNHLNLVSCGQPLSGIDVRIVDPDSHRPLSENTIGEIWIDGESKCAGYWRRPELTDEIFHARVEGDSRGYLRTGDLGFLHEGELFVCGRIKDMIIIHGTNYYPQDIEAIVEEEFPDISPGGPVQTAAFAVEHEGEERLVIAIEVRPNQDRVDPATVAQSIRSRYFIEPYQVLFVPSRAISKTTSGKVARSETRNRWLSGELPVLASYVQSANPRSDHSSLHGLRGLFSRISELYRLRGDEDVTLNDIGLDSLSLVDLTLEIQRHFELLGLSEMVSELDSRFLQRITVAELSQLLEVYEASPDASKSELRNWLEARQQADDKHERQMMQADTQWFPPVEPAEDSREIPKSILMTGGSGFFGPFLLSSLLQRTTCTIEMLIRAADPDHGRARIIDALHKAHLWTQELQEQFHSRVGIVCGNLGQTQLGLNDDHWQRLAGDIDAVVHNGAQVNYVLSYAALRSANIGGTRELLRLAATTRKKPFHLISSTFIHGWSARPIAAEHEFNEALEELDFGYSQSKCVQEHLVLNAARQGHPVRIYRPTLITASSRGIGSRDDIGVRLLAFMIKYGVAIEALNQISFLPADLVSDHIARIFALKETTSNTFHVTTTQYYNIMDVTRSITEQFGYKFTYYPMARFVEEMNRLCNPDDLLYPLLVFFNRSHQKFKPMEPKRYDNRHYRAALEHTRPEIVEPKYSDTVAYIVTHMQREGLIPAPGFATSIKPEPVTFHAVGRSPEIVASS